MELAYLFDPVKQFSDVNGQNNVGGFLRVFIDGTDDRAITYKNFSGTMNLSDITLDNNGRAVVIVDKAKSYRLEVYSRSGALLWTQSGKCAMGGGGSGGSELADYVAIKYSGRATLTTEDTSNGMSLYMPNELDGFAIRGSSLAIDDEIGGERPPRTIRAEKSGIYTIDATIYLEPYDKSVTETNLYLDCGSLGSYEYNTLQNRLLFTVRDNGKSTGSYVKFHDVRICQDDKTRKFFMFLRTGINCTAQLTAFSVVRIA